MGTRAVGWLAAHGGQGWLSSCAESSRRQPSDASPPPSSGLSSGPSSSPLTSGNVLQSPGPQPPAPCPIQGPAFFLSCSEPLSPPKGPPRASVMEFQSCCVFPQLREVGRTLDLEGQLFGRAWGETAGCPRTRPQALWRPPQLAAVSHWRAPGRCSPSGSSLGKRWPPRPLRVFWADGRLCSACPWVPTSRRTHGPVARPLLPWVPDAG